jgi:hypothetical protein
MTTGTKRVCVNCPTPLSQYNTGRRCMACERRRLDDEMGLNDAEPARRAAPVITFREPLRGDGALPRNGYRRELAYLEELRDRMILRDGESDDTDIINRVIAIMEAEARRR